MLQNSTRLGTLSVIIKGVPTTLSLNCQKAGATLVSCTNGWWFFYVCARLEGVHRYNVIAVAFYLDFKTSYHDTLDLFNFYSKNGH